MTNEEFNALRRHITNLLEEEGFRNVKVNMSLGFPPYQFTSKGYIKMEPPDQLHLQVDASATLDAGAFSISAPEEPKHD